MRECHVVDPRILALVAPLRALMTRVAALHRVGSAMVNLLDSGPDLWLRTDGPLGVKDRATLAAFAGRPGSPASPGRARAAATRPRSPPRTAPPPPLLAGNLIPVAPGAFLQATREGEAAIVAAVLDGLPRRMPGRPRLIELHAGYGTLSLPLSARGRVDAYEGLQDAVTALNAAAGRAGARIKATRRDLARQPLLPAELNGAAALVLDPPFAGAAEQSAILARSSIPRVVYVSCNPAALARDLAAFSRAPGWRVERAVAIDQFLWSAGVEAVVTLARGP